MGPAFACDVPGSLVLEPPIGSGSRPGNGVSDSIGLSAMLLDSGMDRRDRAAPSSPAGWEFRKSRFHSSPVPAVCHCAPRVQRPVRSAWHLPVRCWPRTAARLGGHWRLLYTACFQSKGRRSARRPHRLLVTWQGPCRCVQGCQSLSYHQRKQGLVAGGPADDGRHGGGVRRQAVVGDKEPCRLPALRRLLKLTRPSISSAGIR